MPRTVNKIEPQTCISAKPKPHVSCPRSRRETTSAEKLEKVVSPPKKPVMIKSLHSGETEG
jgi:hypothetical protein